MKNFKKIKILLFTLVFLLFHSILNDKYCSFLTKSYLWPAPRFLFAETERMSLFLVVVISTAIFYSTRKHKIFNKIVAVCITTFCVAVLMVNLHSVNTLIEREKNVKDYRFPISQIDSEQLLVIKNHYKQYVAESKIIVFGKAGCLECEKMYPELEEIAENMPVSFAYFDCYAARVYNEMQLEEILKYFEVESVPTVICNKR